MSRGRKPIDPIERFKSKYIIDENTGCWNWVAALSNNGYGIFWFEDKNVYAHRYSFETFKNEITKDKVIMHLCDNPKCVNFNHLKLGTQADNIKDCVNKNRNSKGSKQGNSKLNEIQVNDIKKELLNPYYGILKDLALKYNVTKQAIYHIKNGKNWSHI